MEKYIKYEVYRCPTSPNEYGEYIASTPILQQAQGAVARMPSPGGFIKGVKADGSKVLFL